MLNLQHLNEKRNNIEDIMDRLQALEEEYSKKVDENNEYKRIINRNQKEKHERNSSQFISGGYILTTSDENHSKYNELKKVSAFNYKNNTQLFVKVEQNTKMIGDLMEIVSHVMNALQEKSAEIKGQQDYIIEVDKALEKVEKKQNIIIDDLQYQQNIINENFADFENHK